MVGPVGGESASPASSGLALGWVGCRISGVKVEQTLATARRRNDQARSGSRDRVRSRGLAEGGFGRAGLVLVGRMLADIRLTKLQTPLSQHLTQFWQGLLQCLPGFGEAGVHRQIDAIAIEVQTDLDRTQTLRRKPQANLAAALLSQPLQTTAQRFGKTAVVHGQRGREGRGQIQARQPAHR